MFQTIDSFCRFPVKKQFLSKTRQSGFPEYSPPDIRQLLVHSTSFYCSYSRTKPIRHFNQYGQNYHFHWHEKLASVALSGSKNQVFTRFVSYDYICVMSASSSLPSCTQQAEGKTSYLVIII